MKIKTLIAYFIFTCAISSCIQDEALNSEAAIDVCSGDDVQSVSYTHLTLPTILLV